MPAIGAVVEGRTICQTGLQRRSSGGAGWRGSNRGSWGGGADPDRDIPKFVDLYKQGKLQNIEKLLSNEYTLDDINQALDDLEQGKITRALLLTR